MGVGDAKSGFQKKMSSLAVTWTLQRSLGGWARCYLDAINPYSHQYLLLQYIHGSNNGRLF